MGFRRIAECVIAVAALFVLAIPFLVIAAIQKILDPEEPVFFQQERIGRYGIPITITKFRSMKSTAPHYCPTSQFDGGNEYISKFGRFLRNASIDELPQLFQVVTGKLSLVGPRPLIPQEREIHILRWKAGVYQLRPGITGWAQVNGRDFVSDEEKAAFDQVYLEKIGLKMDAKIFWLTVKKVLTKADIEEGAHSRSEYKKSMVGDKQ